jgi:hypothetical protein
MEPESNPLGLLRQRRAMNRVEAAMRKTEEVPKPGGYRYLGRNADTGQGIIVGNDGSVIPGDIITSGHIKPGQSVRVAQAGGMVQLDQRPRVKKVVPPVVKEEKFGNVKILFSVVEGAETVVYIGADRKKPTEIYRYTTADYRAFIPRLTNTGRGKNKFTASAWALINTNPYGGAFQYQSRILIDLKTKQQVTIEPDVWVPQPYPESTSANYYPVELSFKGNGFYSSGSRQGGAYQFDNQIVDIPAAASTNSFVSAWGPGGGGYDNGSSGEWGFISDFGWGFSVKSRNYSFQIGGALETILGDASLYFASFEFFPYTGSAPGYNFYSRGHTEDIKVNLGLNIEDTVYYKYDIAGQTNPGAPDSSTEANNVRSPRTVIVGNRGVIAQVNNVQYSRVFPGGAETNIVSTSYYYKSTDGNQVTLPSSVFTPPFPERNNYVSPTNYNLVGSTLYYCDTYYLDDYYPQPLLHEDYVDVATISFDGSVAIKQQKIDPLPASGTIIHAVSYHP